MKLKLNTFYPGFLEITYPDGVKVKKLAWTSLTRVIGTKTLVVSDRKFAGSKRVVLSDPYHDNNLQGKLEGKTIDVCESGIKTVGFSSKKVFYVKMVSE